MAAGQPSTRLIMTWGGGRSDIHKQQFVKNDQLSPELLLLLFRKHLQGDKHQSLLPLCSRLRRDFSRGRNPRTRNMKSANRSVGSGTREDLLILLSFTTLFIYHVFISRSNKCTSKIFIYTDTMIFGRCAPIFYFSFEHCKTNKNVADSL